MRSDVSEPRDPKMRTVYTDQFTVSKLEQIVKASLKNIGCTEATERMRQLLQAMGRLRREQSENVRYTPIVVVRVLRLL